MTYHITDEEAAAMAKEQIAGEAAGTAAKSDRLRNSARWMKEHKIKTTLGVGAALTIGSKMAGGSQPAATTDVAASQSEADMVQAIAQANAAGLDINQYLSTPGAKQLGLTPNSIQGVMAKYGQGGDNLVGITAGVYTGNTVLDTSKKVLGPKGRPVPVGKPELLSINKWVQSLPVADTVKLNEYKQKFVDAGVLSPNSGLPELKDAWKTYGQMSLDASRGGTNITPWQLLDIQKGLSGGGAGAPQVSYNISETNPNDVRTYLNRVLSANLGRDATADEFKKFLKQVQKSEAAKPSKSVTTKVGNTTRTKSTPGYGPSDILTDAETFSMQSPEYAQRQTETVFGDALVKALGLK